MEIKLPQLPFLTREMLSFGNMAKLELEVISYASVTYPVKMVGMTREGIFKYDVSSNGTLVADHKNFIIPDIPIFVNIFTDYAQIERGEFFASVFLKVNGERVAKLCSGYISKQSGINYPITHDENEIAGKGNIKLLSTTNPAAGANIRLAIPAGLRWNVVSFKCQLVTDATVATRRIYLNIGTENTDNARQIVCISSLSQAASLTRRYSWAPYHTLPVTSDDFDIVSSIPPNMPIIADGEIATGTKNIQAGDQFSSIRVIVEEFIEN